MKDFLRALRFSWPYRRRLALSALCAMMAAIFWSLNFTAIYPFLQILGGDQNLQEWVNSSIQRVQTEQIKPLEEERKSLEVQRGKLELEKQRLETAQVRGENVDHELERLNKAQRSVERELDKVSTRLSSGQTESFRLHFFKKYIDLVFPVDKWQTLAFVLGLVVVAVALKGVFEFWQETLVASVVNLTQLDMRNAFFRQAVHLDVQNFGEAGTHELMSRFTNDMETLATGQRTLFGKMIAEPLRAVGCILFACWISWQLTFMFLILVPIALFVLTRVGRTMKRATRRLLERMSNIYRILQEVFLGIRIVKAFAREPRERRRFMRATRDYYHRAMWVANLDALTGPIIEVLGAAAIAAALLAGAYLVLNHETHFAGIRMVEQPLEAASLLQLYALLAAISDPVRKLSSVFTKIQSACAAADRVFNYMDRQPKIRPRKENPILARHKKDIEFRNVCFSYDPSKPLLTGIHLHVRHGETVALVGKNGCGKSTLLNLLPRFYDPDHGAVLVDGTDIRNVNLRSLRRQVAIVTQDTILFDDTIFANIAYGKRNATLEEVSEAARKARAHDFITARPLAYDTIVGEGGRNLSGGEKQRICLARAFLVEPSILILDEFTSQADTLAEAEVHQILREFMLGRTTFVITHRLNTLEIADRIVVIDEGRVAACGTHVELLATCPLYQRLHEAQFHRLVA